MPIIDIKIRDKLHQVACPEGEEDHLKDLASFFADKVDELSSSYPNSSDTTLYMMAALMICDELDDTKKKLELSKSNQASTGSEKANKEEIEQAVAKTIDMVTEHIEYIASKLNK